MLKDYTDELPKSFPKELIDSAKSLKHLGSSELAWNWENAQKVIESLSKNNFAILGGDVYCMSEGYLRLTCDSWYYNKHESETYQDYLQNSANRATEYISQYHSKNGNEFYYSIIFTPFIYS
jgi:hypothetical protein